MCSGTLVAAHNLATLPVFGGISGSTNATRIISLEFALEGSRGQVRNKKKRRASLEGLVVSFVRPRGPQMFVCAGGRLAV